jgi:type I restriction enzyme, S subunit
LEEIPNCYLNSFCTIYRLSKKQCSAYMGYFLRSSGPRSYFSRHAQGFIRANISRGVFNELVLHLPHIAEQQKIAACLSSLDELVALHGHKLEALKKYKRGLMQQLFPIEGDTVPRLRFPEFRDAGEWEEVEFEKAVVKSFYGTSSPTAETGEYPVLRMGDMTDGKLNFSNLVYIDLTEDEYEKLRLRDGDILLNRTNSFDLVGKVAIFEASIECITASYIVAFRLDPEMLVPKFCNFELNTGLYKGKIQQIATKSVSQANINPTTFQEKIKVKFPSLPEQRKIASALSSLDDLITAQLAKLEKLKAHKRGLMQGLFPDPEEES